MDSKQKFRIFSLVWSMSTLFHQFTFTDWMGSAHTGIGWLVTIACVLNVLFNTYALFLLGLTGSIALMFLRMPNVPNHIFFEWLSNSTLLLLIIAFFIRYRTLSIERFADELWNSFRPVAKASLVILYFYVVFHKLNSSFLDPAISCGGLFLDDVFHNFYLDRIGFVHRFMLENNLLLRNFSIYFTLLAEAIIPILIVTRRFRNAGLLFGVFFHILLPFQGHEGIYSFSAMLFTFYVFFWDNRMFVKLGDFYDNNNRGIVLFFFASLITLVGVKAGAGIVAYKLASTFSWCIYAFVYFVLLVMAVRNKEIKPVTPDTGRRRFPLVWLGPAVIFFNGLTPYLGLKTEFSFSMFSNLRTEGETTNHYFVPVSTQVFNFQKELVTIIETDNEELKNNDRYYNRDVHLVLFEMIRKMNQLNTDFYVRFEMGGKEYLVRKQDGVYLETSGLNMDQGYLIRKFFRFRPVYPAKSLCQH